MNIRKYGITEVSKMGISRIVKETLEDGMTIITKNDMPAVMVLPLNYIGRNKTIDMFEEVLNKEIQKDETPEKDKEMAMHLLNFYKDLRK